MCPFRSTHITTEKLMALLSILLNKTGCVASASLVKECLPDIHVRLEGHGTAVWGADR